MNVLIIARDPLTSQLLQNRLEADGHEVTVDPVRKTAIERLNSEEFDVIAMDPALAAFTGVIALVGETRIFVLEPPTYTASCRAYVTSFP